MVRFVVLSETSSKEHETWTWFLQYDGNEEELQKLSNYLNRIDQYFIGDTSTYQLDLNHTVSENTANEMCFIKTGNYYGCPQMITGKMRPFTLVLGDNNNENLLKLDEVLYSGLKYSLFD